MRIIIGSKVVNIFIFLKKCLPNSFLNWVSQFVCTVTDFMRASFIMLLSLWCTVVLKCFDTLIGAKWNLVLVCTFDYSVEYLFQNYMCMFCWRFKKLYRSIIVHFKTNQYVFFVIDLYPTHRVFQYLWVFVNKPFSVLLLTVCSIIRKSLKYLALSLV